MKVFEKNITVTKAHIDFLNHVNNVQYVQWIQDIAQEHWEAVAPENFKLNFIWVVAAHHIYYKGESLLGDILAVKTYINDSQGAISHREVEITNNATGKLIMKATTEWCLLNIKSKRPSRIPQDIVDLFL